MGLDEERRELVSMSLLAVAMVGTGVDGNGDGGGGNGMFDAAVPGLDVFAVIVAVLKFLILLFSLFLFLVLPLCR